ncbi:MAG: hypothetical protein Ct9H300mP1_23510 [Planctomycetaceae bacterium]|nr:MAG: hypothetical protein Ct9H300mP1_23510 [Planctomycetaceae bacterium]
MTPVVAAEGQGKEAEPGNYIVLGTLTDQLTGPRPRPTSRTRSQTFGHRGHGRPVCLQPPAILEALQRARSARQDRAVQVIAFDEADETLQGIKDGTVYGTVVQNPYMYGYKSVEVLAALESGKTDVIPEDKFIDIPARQIRKDTVETSGPT